MVDINEIIRAYVVLDADLRALVGSRVYAGRDVPPRGYSPETDGDCVTFRVRGGGADYDDAVFQPSVQFKCYSDDEYGAWQVYRALYDHLHNGHARRIALVWSEALGQILEEPDTEWFFVLGFFRFTIKQID